MGRERRDAGALDEARAPHRGRELQPPLRAAPARDARASLAGRDLPLQVRARAARPPRHVIAALRLAHIALSSLLMATSVTAQDTAVGDVPPSTPRATVPYGIGERAEYSVKFGMFSVGNGLMEVAGLDSVRGREVWHTIFRIRGGVPGYRVNDRLESWIDTRTLSSLRHWQELSEGSRERER